MWYLDLHKYFGRDHLHSTSYEAMRHCLISFDQKTPWVPNFYIQSCAQSYSILYKLVTNILVDFHLPSIFASNTGHDSFEDYLENMQCSHRDSSSYSVSNYMFLLLSFPIGMDCLTTLTYFSGLWKAGCIDFSFGYIACLVWACDIYF